MHQFDTYIDSILRDLNVSKKQKNEIAEEFKDHLEQLKQEFIADGLEEDAAAAKAIEGFGNSKELCKRLKCSMLNYRSKPNILFGIGYILFAVLFLKIALTLYSAQQIDQTKPLAYVQILFVSVILDTIITSPISYFIPIIFKRVRKIHQIALINISIFLSFEVLILFLSKVSYNFLIKESFAIKAVSISIIIVGIFSAILGYIMLNIVNNKTLKFKESVSK